MHKIRALLLYTLNAFIFRDRYPENEQINKQFHQIVPLGVVGPK